MKKSILYSLILLFSIVSFSQTQTIGTVTINGGPKGDPTQVKTINGESIEGVGNIVINSSGTSNPHAIYPTDLTAISNADSDAYLIIQDTLTLTANFDASSTQTWQFTTGAINKNGFDIDLTGVTVYFNGDKSGFIGSGDITGTPVLPIITHASNFGVVPNGIDLKTASATSGSNVVNVTGANFTSDDVGNFISIKGANSGFSDVLKGQKSFNSTITAVNSPTQIVMADNATRTVTDALVWSGKNQFDAIKNLLVVRATSPGKLIYKKGIYYYSKVQTQSGDEGLNDAVTGFLIQGVDDLTIEGYGAIFSAIPHSLQKSRAFTVKDCHRLKIEGGIYRDDLLMHNYSGLPVADQGDDLNIIWSLSTLAIDTKFVGVDIQQTSGTLLTGTGELNFQNYIKGSNATNANQAFTDVTLGTIDRVTGVVTSDVGSDKYYSTALIPMSNTLFEETRKARPDRKGNRHYQFSGSSFAGWAGFKTREYTAFYYDANQNYLYHSGEQRMYDIIEYEDEVAYIRIEGYAPLDITLVDGQIRPTHQAAGLTIENCTFREAAAHLISNAPLRTKVYNSFFDLVYEVLPSFHVNFEDNRDATQDVLFDGCTFKNAWTGYLNFVGTIGAKVTNCTFLKNSDRRVQREDNLTYAISANDNYKSIISGNDIENGIIQLDRQARFFNNTQTGGYVEIIANTVDVYNNDFLNTRITTTTGAANRSLSYVHDQKFYFSKNLGTHLIQDNNHNIKFKNVDVLMNVIRDVTNLIDEDSTFEPIVLGEGTKLFSNLPITEDFGGSLEDFTFSGARHSLATRDYSAESFPIVDMKNVYSESSIGLSFGLPKSRTIENLTVDGYVAVFASDYESSIISATPTLTFKNIKCTIPEGLFNWTNTGSNVFKTYAKNMNIDIDGATFDLQVATSVTGSTNKFIDLNHLGYTKIKDGNFWSVTPITIDFTDTNIFPANLGSFTLIDPDTDKTDDGVQDITFIKRPGDRIRYTKISPNLPVYADNAAAVADGYDISGDMYKTATGDLKTVD